MPVVHIGEIVEQLRALPEKADRVEVLQKNATNSPFRLMLRYMFDPEIKFFDFEGNLPDQKGIRSNIPYGRGISLYSQVRQISMFILAPSRNYPLERMLNLYRRVMENLPGIETELFTAILLKEPIDGINLEDVMEAFPEETRFLPAAPAVPEVTVAETPVPEVQTVPVEAPPAYENGTLSASLSVVSTGLISTVEVEKPVETKKPEDGEVVVKRGPGRPRKNPPAGVG